MLGLTKHDYPSLNPGTLLEQGRTTACGVASIRAYAVVCRGKLLLPRFATPPCSIRFKFLVTSIWVNGYMSRNLSQPYRHGRYRKHCLSSSLHFPAACYPLCQWRAIRSPPRPLADISRLARLRRQRAPGTASKYDSALAKAGTCPAFGLRAPREQHAARDSWTFYVHCPSLTGFAVASARRNQEFHEMFPSIPEGDYLIEGACSGFGALDSDGD